MIDGSSIDGSSRVVVEYVAAFRERIRELEQENRALCEDQMVRQARIEALEQENAQLRKEKKELKLMLGIFGSEERRIEKQDIRIRELCDENRALREALREVQQ